jgi:hypothetical protein
MIVWINGAFGGGKTTLAEELHRRLPQASVGGQGGWPPTLVGPDRHDRA